ncbi:MAG: 16S rRNA (cytidine(1402)-2'-O)-methyltransferase [Armatimonadota bacterium]
MPGILYIVATPIGNLEDITLRALRILKEVACIACEDTRVSIKLLNHYGIKKKLIPYYKFNQREQEDYFINLLKEGRNIALISDAGTPAINDPGEFLIARCVKEKIKLSPVPGACSFIAGLISSGIETTEFTYLGYLPGKKSELETLLNNIKNEARTLIFYETPHRLRKTLELMHDMLGERKICLAKEITKIHEKFTTDSIGNILKTLPEKVKGEYIIIIEGNKEKNRDFEEEIILKEIKKYKNIPAKEVAKFISEKYDIPKNKAYNLVVKNKE